MASERRPGFLLLLWILVLLAPAAWSLMLVTNFPLVQLACKAGTRTPLVVVNLVTLALAIAAPLIAWRKLGQTPEVGDVARRIRFMLQLSIGMSVIFALVILVSAIPIFMLSPCPE